MPAVWLAVILRLSASSCQMIQMLSIKIHFFPSVLRGISQVASQHQYAIQIATGKDEKERMTAISQMVHGRRVDGLIFLYAEENDPLVRMAYEEQFPFLILGKSLSPLFHWSTTIISKRGLMQLNISLKKVAAILLLSEELKSSL